MAAVSSWQDKLTSAERAVWHIRSGDTVFIGSACAAPRELVHALEQSEKPLKDIQLIHYLVDRQVYPLSSGRPTTRFPHKVFYVGSAEEQIIEEGRGDLIHYIPLSAGRVPRLFDTGRFPIDVALIQTTMPDKHGYVSLGISVDITKPAVANARTVIAEINPRMPWTRGDSAIPVDRIDHMVEVDTPLISYLHPDVDESAERISRYIASIIDDGSTLQIGIGRYPNGVLKYLDKRRNLGIHSDIVCEEIIDLIEKGIITGEEKTVERGRVVASHCMGTERLYKYIDNNPMFSFQPLDTVCRVDRISRNRKMVSITQAWAIDLMGQVCCGQLDGTLYGGVSVTPDFIRGAAESEGGKPIICLESTYRKDGAVKSRIRPLLKEGEGVTISRSDVHYVVTEYGIAYLYGKSISERALRLIQIAHPDFRDELLSAAKRQHYIRDDYVLESRGAYPEHEERKVTLKDSETVLIRPSQASDYRGVQDLFYRLPPKDVSTRFFSRLSSLPEAKFNFLWNVDGTDNMAFVAMSGEQEDERIIGNANYSLDATTNLAEFAYMVHPAWQGKGLGSALKRRMIEYAKAKGIRGYYEEFLEENAPMKHLAEKSDNATVIYEAGVGRAETIF